MISIVIKADKHLKGIKVQQDILLSVDFSNGWRGGY